MKKWNCIGLLMMRLNFCGGSVVFEFFFILNGVMYSVCIGGLSFGIVGIVDLIVM